MNTDLLQGHNDLFQVRNRGEVYIYCICYIKQIEYKHMVVQVGFCDARIVKFRSKDRSQLAKNCDVIQALGMTT